MMARDPNYESLSTFVCVFANRMLAECIEQKQQPDVFYKKGVLKNFAKFT